MAAHLLDGLDDLLQVQLIIEPLHRRDALAAVALLHTDVDEILLLGVDLSIGKGVGAPAKGVLERVCGRTGAFSLAVARPRGGAWQSSGSGGKRSTRCSSSE